MNQKNTITNENRYLSNHEKILKRIKNGVILTIIFVIAIIVSYAVLEINKNWMDVVRQDYYIKYRDDEINNDTYNSIIRNLDYDQLYFRWIISIVSNLAEVGLNIGFFIIILSFFYIAIDKSYNKKLRRISLILAGSSLVFLMFLNFQYLIPGVVDIIYYPPRWY